MSIIEHGKIRMANLALVGSHKVNGVAELHTEILKNQIFHPFFEMFPEKFLNITNGVTQRRWLLNCNPELSNFITHRIGDGWISEFKEIRKLANFASDAESQHEFLSIKKKNKHRLIQFIEHHNLLRNSAGEFIGSPPIVHIDSLFDVQVKRIHEYKRQLMNALHIVMLYHDILANPELPRIRRTFIFGGKSAAGYETAKNIIRFISCVARKINRDPAVKELIKVIYIENYNVSKAEIIIPAAELSEQISSAGMEASGTGNMKLSINGALTIGTNDGANIEMKEEITPEWWPFSFGCSAEEIILMRTHHTYHPADICASNPKILRAVETLHNRTFAQSEDEHQAFCTLYNKLMEGHFGEPPDRFFVLKDLEDYYQTQKKVEQLYRQPEKWAEYAIHNIAGMGKFSSDYSIKNYAEKIWGLQPLLPDIEILDRVRFEYSEHDKCRIY